MLNRKNTLSQFLVDENAVPIHEKGEVKDAGWVGKCLFNLIALLYFILLFYYPTVAVLGMAIFSIPKRQRKEDSFW